MSHGTQQPTFTLGHDHFDAPVPFRMQNPLSSNHSCVCVESDRLHRRFVAATVLYNAIEVQREVGMTGHTPLPVRVVAGAHDAVTAETQAPLYLG